MKKITFILIALISGTIFGQTETANANASADIVSPITITKVKDLDFGKIIADATASTTIILKQDGTIDAASTGNPVTTSTTSAASFNISATQSYTYTITMPANLNLGAGMDVVLSSNMQESGNTSGVGAENLLVGGTLTVGAGQAPGNYSTSFDVTVAYE